MTMASDVFFSYVFRIRNFSNKKLFFTNNRVICYSFD